MHECIVNYDDCLANKHHVKTVDPFASYFQQRGATVTSNVFYDRDLVLGDIVFDNLLMLVKSAKNQGFEKVTLYIRKELIKYTIKVAYQLMALEQIVIETTHEEDSTIFIIYFPQALWLKATYGNARGRTSLHSKYMDEESLTKVKKCCELPMRSESDIDLLKFSLDLEDQS